MIDVLVEERICNQGFKKTRKKITMWEGKYMAPRPPTLLPHARKTLLTTYSFFLAEPTFNLSIFFICTRLGNCLQRDYLKVRSEHHFVR